MAKVRGLLLAGLLGVVLTGVLPGPSAVAATGPAPSVAVTQASELHQAPPGPVLDPSQTDKANAEKTRNKLIAGGAAVVLLAIVFFGRRRRIKRRKAQGS
ncbi:hypothetical protein [Amycolatopsis jiangsuensis]|uniref:Uncharacterized protein n=1 Tax=Amycolatopsis jiangsuensis TaxID=1181879 RepID=A0A840IUP8_9PSEU|nr:hypothetical protein [Amycolatopsis jiangsuensis]MBB4686216.1 hypothetical protein [Amycolatopsis jiangsuensis]